jgi:GT2 family glycosyltransferase
MVDGGDVGVVVIGRNEGDRLRLCLLSLKYIPNRVYVDSGSTDGSQALAQGLGFDVVELAVPPKFTAARARNTGLRHLLDKCPGIAFVQMVDGDCEVSPSWIAVARAELEKDPRLAVAFGRRRERYPNATIYNMMCDDEWDVPVGEATSCGGDAMFRVAAFSEVSGYNEALIAGEEPDLCLRLRQRHWTIRRIPAEMTLHDVALDRFGQWWKRAIRGGHAFAELVYRHGDRSDPSWIRQLASFSLWGALGLATPALLLIALLLTSPALALLATGLGLLLLIQTVRLAVRRYAGGMPLGRAVPWAYLIMIGKIAQLQGALQFHARRILGRNSTIIEYKT